MNNSHITSLLIIQSAVALVTQTRAEDEGYVAVNPPDTQCVSTFAACLPTCVC